MSSTTSCGAVCGAWEFATPTRMMRHRRYFRVFAKRLERVTPALERAFLFGTAVRIASNRRRQSRRSPEDLGLGLDELCAPGLSPEELSGLSRARRQLQEIMDGMTEEQRAVFVLMRAGRVDRTRCCRAVGVARGHRQLSPAQRP